MSPDCRNDCVPPVTFPNRPYNRPGLSHIGYRIGAYSDFREALLDSLNKDPNLTVWTHREPDDPGIALLEGISILGDILTFYQETYANEAYLRTALWRDSVAGLVRLLGYRLSPGLGGAAVFAFGVRGTDPVAIPAGFPLKAQVGAADQSADFQTTGAAVAFPHLSQFHLYRPRLAAPNIASGGSALEVQAADGQTDTASIAALGLKKGDRLMLVPSAPMFDVNGAASAAQQKAEILIVSEVTTVLDRVIVKFEGALAGGWGAAATAYKLGRSFYHFGYNAPAVVTTIDASHQATAAATAYTRSINGSAPAATTNYSAIAATDAPLHQSVGDLAGGGTLIVQGFYTTQASANPAPFCVAKTIVGIHADSLVWGNLTAAATVVTSGADIIANESLTNAKSDIRQILFHETKSPPITLRAPSAWADGNFTDGNLTYFGSYDQVLALAGRRVLLSRADGVVQQLKIATAAADLSLTGRDAIHPWLWPIALSTPPQPFSRSDFDESAPTVTVYGNLADATQGKAEKPAVLGNGDSRAVFQTFKIPKTPLTYLNDPGRTPPETPQMQVFVAGQRWTLAPTLFGAQPSDQVYIVREDANQVSWVQFGDGKTGARLPSGVGNVTAEYRSGDGAFGALQAGTTVQAGGKIDRLDKIWLPEIVTGGAAPEDGAGAREAAPGKVQALDRLVSLRDFETETLAVSGVSKASAAWDLLENTPAVTVIVLMETGRAGELSAVQDFLSAANRSRGPRRFPVIVSQGRRSYLYLDAVYSLRVGYQEEIVTKAVKAALGVTGAEADGVDGSAGLLGLPGRGFGEREYATRIAGAIQNVDGVAWASVTAFGVLGDSDDPASLPLPPEPKPLSAAAPCASDRVLALFASHVQLRAVPAPTGDC